MHQVTPIYITPKAQQKHSVFVITPGKINMEPENTPLEKEKHLPDSIIFRFYVNLRGCKSIFGAVNPSNNCPAVALVESPRSIPDPTAEPKRPSFSTKKHGKYDEIRKKEAGGSPWYNPYRSQPQQKELTGKIETWFQFQNLIFQNLPKNPDP